MIRIHATVSKKVPIPGLSYSSRNYMAGLEVEAGDSCSPEEIRRRISELYALLEESVDREIAVDVDLRAPQVPQSLLLHSEADNPKSPPSVRYATRAQVNAIHAIAKSVGLDKAELSSTIEERYDVPSADKLSVKQASEFITTLKQINSSRTVA